MQYIKHSFRGNRNASAHIADGVIPIRLTKNVEINLSIEDIRVLNSTLDIKHIDFTEWEEWIHKYNDAIESQMKGNLRLNIFSYQHKEKLFFSFSSYDIDDEKDVCMLNAKDADDSLYNKVRDSIVSNYKDVLDNAMKMRMERFTNMLSGLDFTYIDSTDLEIKEDNVTISVSNWELIQEAIIDYFNSYYKETIEYMKRYVNSKRTKEAIEIAKLIEDNKGEIEKLEKLEKVKKEDIIDILGKICPDYEYF